MSFTRSNEEELVNKIIAKSLITLEEERINKLKQQVEEDEMLLKVIEESINSNVSIISNSNIINQDLENPERKNTDDEDDVLNSILTKSIVTLEEERLAKSKEEEDDDTILSRVLEESLYSNISIQGNTNIINSRQIPNIEKHNDYDYDNNDYDYDEEEYMKMIIQQIKENEEREYKLKKNKNSRNIIDEQDFEYEESLRQDIAKEKIKEDIIINSDVNIDDDKPKSKEEIRAARLLFYQKK